MSKIAEAIAKLTPEELEKFKDAIEDLVKVEKNMLYSEARIIAAVKDAAKTIRRLAEVIKNE
jgi:hypothetical protein